MSRQWFGREPALVIAAISAILTMLVGLGLPGLNDQVAAAITTVFVAAATVYQAFAVQPVAPTVFSGLIVAAAALLSLLGVVQLDQVQVAMVTATVAAVMALVVRAQSTPVHDPLPLTEVSHR